MVAVSRGEGEGAGEGGIGGGRGTTRRREFERRAVGEMAWQFEEGTEDGAGARRGGEKKEREKEAGRARREEGSREHDDCTFALYRTWAPAIFRTNPSNRDLSSLALVGFPRRLGATSITIIAMQKERRRHAVA